MKKSFCYKDFVDDISLEYCYGCEFTGAEECLFKSLIRKEEAEDLVERLKKGL